MVDAAELLLLAGRATASRRMPYLSKALYAMRPVRSEELSTAAVDKHWRMYWNPSFIAGLNTDEVATVWLHEVGHLMRDHGRRAKASMVPQSLRHEWNIAADAPINGDLREAGIPVFDWMVFPEKIDPSATFRDTTESLYERIVSGRNQAQQDSGSGAGDQSPDGAGTDSTDSEGTADGETGEGGGDDRTGDAGDSDVGDGEGDSDGGEDEGDSGDGEGGPSADGDQAARPGDGASDCGSGSGGDPRPWELPPSAADGSVDDGRAQRIRTQVAHDIAEHISTGIGTVPAGLERWAEQFLKPQVDWRRELRSTVRRISATHMGRSNYSYNRPRRVPGARGVIFPGMVDRPPPILRVIVDTSGSMDAEQLGYAVAEIGDIVRRISHGGGSVDVLACDAAVAVVQTIRRPGNVDLSGGGGTDMRVGIRAAAEAAPQAHIIITATDGFTPWPDEPPQQNRDARYIALIVPPDRPTRPGQTVRESPDPPTWMHTIRMAAER